MENKRGLSAVIVMVVMIALVLSLMAVVITLTKRTVEEKISQTESCGVEIIDKFLINRAYVCYDSSKQELIFSIDRRDADLDKLLISVSSESESQVFEMRNKVDENFEGKILSYPDRSEIVRLPGKNGGRTYILTGFSEQPTDIQIAPVINGKQCDVTDSVGEIVDCSLTTILS